MQVFPSSLVLVGAGKMGLAMLEGWLGAGFPATAVTVLDPAPSMSLRALADHHGFPVYDGVTHKADATQIKPCDVVVLAIKPQMLDQATDGFAPWVGPQSLVISVLAGKTVANVVARLPQASMIVRAMPNLPASVLRGMTGCYAAPTVSDVQKTMAQALLEAVGSVEWVETEALIDSVTAVSGSGPAYVFLLVECLTQAGVREGLPLTVAARLARKTIEGAGELLHQSDLSAETLRQNVTSPAGTTAAALDVLMAEQDGLAPLMIRAVRAARLRAEALSG
jgi:pyrroline-5-carboxylate reductase